MKTISPEFVEFIPDKLENGILYISITYRTAIHKCCCGCGKEVVTPISPIDWKLTFDGESVSLDPSVGNWNFDCKSHYWIINNRIKIARLWSDWEIDYGRRSDNKKKKKFYRKRKKKK